MALIDSMLAENIHAVYRQKRNGVLTAVGPTLSMRFCFQDGSPVAIDLGEEKDRLLVQTMQAYHRLNDAQAEQVIAEWQAGRGSVADLCVARSFASEQEVAHSTQAMVEDALTGFFSSKIQQVTFDEQGIIDGFDFERRAFRLRIDAEVLLRTVDARIAEIRTMKADYAGFSAVFVFNEDSPGSGTLSDQEKRLLDFVDGHTPISEIALHMRDSAQNTTRALAAMAVKRIIRRVGATSGSHQSISGKHKSISGPQKALTPEQSGPRQASAAAAAAMRSATPTMRDFTPYRQVDEPPARSRFMTVVLALVLALLCVIGVMVYDYQKRQAEFREAMHKLEESLGRADWASANQQIDDARQKAGKDISAQQQVEGMELRLRTALDNELTAIEKLSADADHQAAGQRLAKLPGDPKVDAMRSKIARNQQASLRRSRDLNEQVTELLAKEDAVQAVTTVAESPLIAREKRDAEESIDRWRIAKLELAASSTGPLAQRTAALTALKGSSAPERMASQIAQADSDIQRQRTRISEQIATVRKQLDQGSVDAAAKELDRLGLVDQVTGTSLASDVTAITARISEIRAAMAALRQGAVDAIGTIDKPDLLAKQTEVAKTSATSPLPGIPAMATQITELLGEIAAISGEQSPDAQAAAVLALVDKPKLDPALAGALKARAERLRNLEAEAVKVLDDARALARDGRIEQAIERLEGLLARTEMRATLSRPTTEQELSEFRTRLGKRDELKKRLNQAIASGDVTQGSELARQLGLKYLPLAIESLPSGAEVLRDGAVIGVTPLVLDISAAERVDYQLELRLPGYSTATASGAKAEAGWRLLVPLQRQPAATASLVPGEAGQQRPQLTGHPTVIDGQVVISGRAGVATLDSATNHTQWMPFAGLTVDSPVYAPASAGDKGELLIGTRDQVALSVRAQAAGGLAPVSRLPLAVRTDGPVLIHRSQLIVDRRFLIHAGLDGTVRSTDDQDANGGWKGPSGSPILAGPKAFGDVIAVVRADGTIERLQADDGAPLTGESIGAAVVAAMVTDKGFLAYTATEQIAYDGETLTRSALPQPVIDGVDHLVVTLTNRVLVRSTTGDQSWTEVARIDRKPTATPVVWNGHAVIVLGASLWVYGPRGFRYDAPADILAPVIVGNRLVVVSQDGTVVQYDP